MRGVVLLSLLLVVAFASDNFDNKRSVYLRSHTIDTLIHSKDLSRFTRSVRSEEGLLQWLVQLKHPNTHEMRSEVEEVLGVRLGTYVPYNTYLTVGGRTLKDLAEKSKHILWVGPYLPEYKLSPSIKNLLPTFDKERIKIAVEASLAKNCPQMLNNWKTTLAEQGLNFEVETSGACDFLVVKTSKITEVAAALAELPETNWIEPVSTYFAQNMYATGIVKYGVPQSGKTLGVTGQGQTVALGDTGVSVGTAATCFLSSTKVTNCQTAGACSDSTGHGTAAATIIAGSATDPSTSPYNGHAPNAQIFSIPLPSSGGGFESTTVAVPTMTGYLATVLSSTAPISLSSFTGTVSTSYTSDNVNVDTWAVTNPNVLLIFPAGNTGANGFYTIASPSSSKNVLTVGSSQNDISVVKPGSNFTFLYGKDIVSTDSSRGPTFDGRIKPDVVAPGEFITSSDASGCALGKVRGTSFAAAAAAGAAALVREWMTKNGFPTPTGAQLKAVLINSGVKLTGLSLNGPTPAISNFVYLDGPDYFEGFGRIQLNTSLPSDSFLYVSPSTSSVTSTQPFRQCFQVPAGLIKATLTWTDPAAALSAAFALVNNLDMILLDTNTGIQYRANKLSTLDNMNNVEKISAYIPTATVLAAYVSGTAINSGSSQTFALAVSGPAAVTTTNCPADNTCPSLCGGHGTCNAGLCSCSSGYSGPDCSITLCPGNCNIQNNQGICDLTTMTCDCINQYSGSDCSISPSQSSFVNVQQGVPQGAFIGAIIGGIIIGMVLGCVIGPFIALKFLERERKQKREQLMRGQGDM